MLDTLFNSFSTKWLFEDNHVFAFDCDSHSHKFIVYYDGSGFSIKPNQDLKELLTERYAYGTTLSVEFLVEDQTLSFPFSAVFKNDFLHIIDEEVLFHFESILKQYGLVKVSVEGIFIGSCNNKNYPFQTFK